MFRKREIVTLLRQFKCHIIKAEQLTTAVAGSATETHNNDNQQLQKMHTNTPPSTIGDSAEQMFSYQISHECCIAGECNVQAKFVAKLLHSPVGLLHPAPCGIASHIFCHGLCYVSELMLWPNDCLFVH